MTQDLPKGSVPLFDGLPGVEVAPGGTSSPSVSLPWQRSGPKTFVLRSGMKIRMAAPKGSLSLAINGVLADFTGSPTAREVERRRVEWLMYITHIDDIEQPLIRDAIMRAALEQKIGWEFLDGLADLWMEHFPQDTKQDIQIIKNS